MLYQQIGVQATIGWDVVLPLLLMVALFALAVPIWVSLGITALTTLWTTGALPLRLFGETLFNGIDSFALIAIPLYVLTGDALVRTGLADKLLDIAEATVGTLRSGLGTSTILGCGFFACISGSDSADCAAIGRVTYDRLVKRGYPKPYACALIASGACTGILIPPSIAYIIIGLVLGISASDLFIAAAVPGVMTLLSLMITNIIINRRRGYENTNQSFSFSVWLRAVWDGRYAILIPLVILGGIYTGIFTPTEAAAVAVIITISVGLLKGTLTLADFPKMLESSAKLNGIVVPVLAVSLPMAQALTLDQVPQLFASSIIAFTNDPTLVILLMIAVFIVAGCVMESAPNIVILSPIMLPLAEQIGMNEIQFCIFMMTALGIGFVTPPLGLNLFVITGLTGESILSVARRAIPYVLAMFIVLLLVAFIPELSLWAFAH